MDKPEKKTTTRRDFLFTTSYTVGAVGLGAVIWPLIDQMNPDKAQKALATTEVDISQIEPGKSITVLCRGKPVFLKRRTQEEILEARSVSLNDLPDPEKDEERVKSGKDEWLVMLVVCTHLGCVPLSNKGDYKGWFCPCHGSHYDLSCRIRKGPAPKNMEIPKYEFVDANTIKIGMMHNAELINGVYETLDKNKIIDDKRIKIILDPVMVAKGGHRLLKNDAINALKHFINTANPILTPNIPEAEILTGMKIDNFKYQGSKFTMGTYSGSRDIRVTLESGGKNGDLQFRHTPASSGRPSKGFKTVLSYKGASALGGQVVGIPLLCAVLEKNTYKIK